MESSTPNATNAGRRDGREPLRVALVAPVWTRTPPDTYGGTERVVHLLAEQLVRLGHDVTLFATGDSTTSAALRAVAARGVSDAMLAGEAFEYEHYVNATLVEALRPGGEFDVVHSHLRASEVPIAELSPLHVLHTLHSPISVDDRWVLERYPRADVTAISHFQASALPPWRRESVRVIHHGIDVDAYTHSTQAGEYLAFLGRMGPQKSPRAAIQIALAAGVPIVLAGGPQNAREEEFFARHVRPLVDGRNVSYVGPVDHAAKNELLRNAAALLFPIAGDEAFGLVMVEAMACGTPVLACDRASVREIVDAGETGFYAESPDELARLVPRAIGLDRAAVRERAVRRFGHHRMARDYVDAYRSLLESRR